MSAEHTPANPVYEYALYSYFRSSCTARVRIALNIKNIPYTQHAVNLLTGEQMSDEHRARNPSASVPLLVISEASSQSEVFRIGQSVAILEYLEETHPEVALLPHGPGKRAIIRTLVNIIACDVQPVTNLRVVRKVGQMGGDKEQWMREHMCEGLGTYETVAREWSGVYSVGDEVSLADVVLMPAVWNAERYGVDVSQWPTITRVRERMEGREEVRRAYYFNQEDCPAELKESDWLSQ